MAADRAAAVILMDPIFQGLAISLMAGEVASTLLSRMAAPVLYYMSESGKLWGHINPSGRYSAIHTGAV